MARQTAGFATGLSENAIMNMLMHLNRSAQQLQQSLHHLPWQQVETPSEPPTGSWVVAVALVSTAAAVVLVLAQ